MKITVEYATQLRLAAKASSELLELSEGTTVRAAIHHLVERKGEPFRGVLLGEDHRLRPGILIFLNGNSIAFDSETPLVEKDTLTMMTLVSGG